MFQLAYYCFCLWIIWAIIGTCFSLLGLLKDKIYYAIKASNHRHQQKRIDRAYKRHLAALRS
jgi:hypothetical protein